MADSNPMTERERQLPAQIEKLQTERLQLHPDFEAAKASRDILQANADFLIHFKAQFSASDKKHEYKE
jgi:hypothetical protein